MCRPDDVVAAVSFARSNQLRVSVRGGGHGIAGHAVCDGGLVIDLSLMTSIDVDPTRRTVAAGAGALLGDLDRATQEFGLAVPAGTVSETGIAGLTLGGGLGWLMRKHGLTCDNLIGVRMVTAGGELVRVDDASHGDLMWGLRGGGGNFGIVTTFEYRAHAVGPTVLAGFVLHPVEQATDFFEFYANYTADAPDELTTIGVIRMMPPVPSVPAELHGVKVAGTGVCWSGDIEQGQRVLEPLRNYGTPLMDTIGPTPFVAHQSVLDEGVPAGLHYYEKAENLPDLTPELIETLVYHAEQVSSPYAFVGLFQLGGEVGRVAEGDTAYTQRDAAYSLVISAGWEDPQATDHHTNWVRSFWKVGAAPFRGRWLHQLHVSRRREGPGAGGLWAREICASRRPEEPIRSTESLPAESEHQANWLSTRTAPRVASGFGIAGEKGWGQGPGIPVTTCGVPRAAQGGGGECRSR